MPTETAPATAPAASQTASSGSGAAGTGQTTPAAPEAKAAAAPSKSLLAPPPAKPDAAKAEGTDAKVEGTEAPKAAELELKLPDGLKGDDPTIGQFREVAKELGLKSDGAQKIFDLYVGAQQAARQAAVEKYEQQQKAWVESATNDKEFGGAKFEENLSYARKAIAKFGSPELEQLLDQSGFGNNPALVRFAYRIGKAMAEDSVAGSASQANGASDSAESFHRKLYEQKTPQLFRKE